jgi:DNA-cytosine methyltransferase
MSEKNIVSVFDGMSCGQIALNELGFEYDNYFASEIDEFAKKITLKNYPNTKHIGDIYKVDGTKMKNTHLFMGGSPCQSFSRSGDGTGFDGKSGLFWEYVRVLKEINPKWFLLENVVMKKEWEDIITKELGVSPIMIDSKFFSAQKRQRLYWTNIPVDKIVDENILIQDIIDVENRIPVDVGELLWFENGEYRVKNATKKGYLTVENYDVINLDFPKSKTRRGRVSP